MTKTTTAEFLLARATDYESKAMALRLAAAELTGHLTQSKQQDLKSVFAHAIVLRDQQRPKRTAETKQTQITERVALIRTALAEGPKSVKDLRALVQTQQGHGVSHARILQMLNTQFKGEVARIGNGQHSRWTLKVGGFPAKPAKAAKTATPAKKETAQKRKRHKGDAQAKARVVAGILQKAGKPMPIRDLTKAAREQGIPGLTGIHNYVKQGFIKRNVNGNRKKATYSFLAMPPAATSSAAPAA
jgi:hypothetical protein